ncbi:MAG: serine/threonine-protein kinase [Candidatus Solibacter usitatus]|nr:serine/threonine-protein kinase [Candidatus Solibacter usitatus]
MSLIAGTTLGPYKIVSLLGEGGMGAVYKAHDPRLGRYVAIKVAKEQFSERFDREARAVAALNHNNICTLYDVGPNYLVMEYVEGPMLSARIRQGAMTLDEALPILRQLVDAIEAAHDKNIYHRDLKPDNIKITPQGVVKVLDFGLAKAADPLPQSSDPANATTLKLATVAGVIMGTPEYMSPEQASGLPADKRADIWAFAVIALEMFTARKLFEAETVLQTLAEVLKKEFDVAGAPPEIQPLLKRCLVRDACLRMRDIGEARIALRDPMAQAEAVANPQHRWLIPALIASLVAAITLGGGWWLATRPIEKPLIWMNADLGVAPTLTSGGGLAISRDGRRIAFAGGDAAKSQLYYRRIEYEQSFPVPGTNGARYPFFSPDGNWIGFFADQKLKKVPTDGGAPVVLCDAPAGRGASWGEDGFIAAALNTSGNLMKVPEGGGAPTTLMEIHKDERTLRFPQHLPRGKGLLFMALKSGANYEFGTIELFSFADRKRKVLREGGRYPKYLASGHVAYVLNGTLFAFPFSLDRMEAGAAPTPLLTEVSYGGPGNAFIDVSENGTLIFLKGSTSQNFDRNYIQWLDSTGKMETLAPQGGAHLPRLSPDGTKLIYIAPETGFYSAFRKDLLRDTTSKLTTMRTVGAAWTADSKNIVYGTEDGGLFWMRSDGSGTPHLVLEHPGKFPVLPMSISPDGRRLLYKSGINTISHYLLSLEPGGGVDAAPKAGKPELFLNHEGTGVDEPTLSPDGKWVAYHTTDPFTQVYVRPVSEGGGKWQVSGNEGGMSAAWSPKGRELFYIGRDGRIRVVDYTANGSAFTLGKPRVWAEVTVPIYRATLSPSPDGKRIATVIYPDSKEAPVRTVMLFNFLDEVRRKMK